MASSETYIASLREGDAGERGAPLAPALLRRAAVSKSPSSPPPRLNKRLRGKTSSSGLVGECVPLQPIMPKGAPVLKSTPLSQRDSRGTTPLSQELRDRRTLPSFVKAAVASLPDEVIQRMCANLRRTDEPMVVTIGTCCSGSEMYLTSLPLLAAELTKAVGTPVRFEHRWSCESVKAKREWIYDNFRPSKIFCDITQLAQEGGAYDAVSGRVQPVDAVSVVIAGTSCKDASRLNSHHGSRLDAVDSGSHTTGSTFKGLMDLVRKMTQCRLVFLENVPSLKDKSKQTGRSNFDGVQDHVRSAQYLFLSKEFNAADMGLPIKRPRLYLAAVRAGQAACPAMLEQDSQTVADLVLSHVVASADQLPLDLVLLQDYSPEQMIRDWAPELTGGCQKRSAGTRWQAEHKAEWASVPEELCATMEQQLSNNIWFESLPPRQQDLLLLQLCKAKASAADIVSIALQTSAGWATAGNSDCLPTQVPRSKTWLVRRRRLLLGVEGLMLQGCDVRDLPACRPGSHSSSFLQDLAGNAFCVHQFVAWFLACLAVTDFNYDQARDGASAEMWSVAREHMHVQVGVCHGPDLVLVECVYFH